MIKSRDDIKTFIPKGKTKLVILGTMCSAAARTVGNRKAADEAFYYHSPINRFWTVLQLIFEKNKAVKKLSIDEKTMLLNKHGIAIVNIVQEISVPDSLANDPSDSVLFEANRKGNLRFKTASSEFKTVLKSKPLFFTCRYKRPIHNLLEGYFIHNKVDPRLLEKIWYLHSPTRKSAQKIADIWTDEISTVLNNYNSND